MATSHLLLTHLLHAIDEANEESKGGRCKIVFGHDSIRLVNAAGDELDVLQAEELSELVLLDSVPSEAEMAVKH